MNDLRRRVATMLRLVTLSVALPVRARPVERIRNVPVFGLTIDSGTLTVHSSVPAVAVWTASISTAYSAL